VSRIAVIGAGPAGLTTGHRLRAAGHEVTVFEERDVPGGRTHSEHYGPDHWSDTGAGWLAGFYPRTLALFDELGERGRLRELKLRGGGDLLLDGRLVPNPNSITRIVATPLLSPLAKVRFFGFMALLFATQRGRLRLDRRYDDRTAEQALRLAGRDAIERIVRPSFEGPFFSRLEELSGALIRSWLRDLSIGTFYQVDGGMDAPWRALGESLQVRSGASVELVETTSNGVRVTLVDGDAAERFDGAVVAVPAPVAARIVASDDLPPAVREIRYAPHVRLYAARRAEGPPRVGVHVFPNDAVATVELGTGHDGGWGSIPDDMEWALVCAPSASSGPFMTMDDDAVKERLWSVASAIEPRLFPLAGAEIVHLIRWPNAVPIVERGYLARTGTMPQRPPLVFAGDWLVQPCVEGAVRSGEQAAAAFGRATSA
jgi:protoporphyrinogen/coproporphyrinogen III oxidase